MFYDYGYPLPYNIARAQTDVGVAVTNESVVVNVGISVAMTELITIPVVVG